MCIFYVAMHAACPTHLLGLAITNERFELLLERLSISIMVLLSRSLGLQKKVFSFECRVWPRRSLDSPVIIAEQRMSCQVQAKVTKIAILWPIAEG